ncbi:hypothetical protein D9M68_929470 [compost metagenome]
MEHLATPVKGISIADLLRGIRDGEERSFDAKYTRYLRSKCSELKWEFPDRVYSVNENKIQGITKVSWKPAE